MHNQIEFNSVAARLKANCRAEPNIVHHHEFENGLHLSLLYQFDLWTLTLFRWQELVNHKDRELCRWAFGSPRQAHYEPQEKLGWHINQLKWKPTSQKSSPLQLNFNPLLSPPS